MRSYELRAFRARESPWGWKLRNTLYIFYLKGSLVEPQELKSIGKWANERSPSLMSLSQVPQQAGSSFSSTTILSLKRQRISVRFLFPFIISITTVRSQIPCIFDRRALHWREGHRQVRKAPMVQRQWLPSCDQEVRAALAHE